mgnify:CR=1 FL=1
MKIYVAGNRHDIPRIQHLMAKIEQMGHTITHDWTEQSKGLDAEAYSTSELARKAVEDIEGVRKAELVVALLDQDLIYRGALGEVGAALALGKPVAIIGEQRQFVFFYHPSVSHRISVDDFLGSLESGWFGR